MLYFHRSKKISVLIHNSDNNENIQSCTVAVHFQKIIDRVCEHLRHMIISYLMCLKMADNVMLFYLALNLIFKHLCHVLFVVLSDLSTYQYLLLSSMISPYRSPLVTPLTPAPPFRPPQGDDDFDVVPDTKLVVARTAFRDNSSFYTVNGRRTQFKAVARLLRAQGIDLDHNRFLILQVSRRPARCWRVSGWGRPCGDPWEWGEAERAGE